MAPSVHHKVTLPRSLDLPDNSIHPHDLAQEWLTQLESQFASQSPPDLSSLFHQESWWRDMLALDWDFHTVRGIEKIQDYIGQNQPRARIEKLRVVGQRDAAPVVESPENGLTWVRAMFEFETVSGSGSGVVYLTSEETPGQWKAWVVYTSLQSLRGLELALETSRPEGTVDSMPGGISQGTWIERRRREVEFEAEDPTVLVIGAGQSGLNISARLQTMGLSCLVVDQNERVGDNWRHRYRTLVTHDHVDVTHLAYLPFPKTWPKYSSKDKLADWFEAYATLMDLNIWLKSTVKSAEYEEDKQRWLVTVTRAGNERVIRPAHIVWCAGQFGVPKIPSFATGSPFQGTVYHSKDHQDAAIFNPSGKKVVVVGTGNSGHDIAQDFYENGAEVTLLQRGGTYVLGQEGLPLLPENDFVDNDSILTEEVDLLSESLPWPVVLALCRENTRQIAAADRAVLDGLKETGFQLDFGPDGQGILGMYVHRGGGYYIDFGCSQLIIDGKIKIHNCPGGATGLNERGLILGDGNTIDADIVVFATGYDGPMASVRKVLGSEVADRCNRDVWGLDEEGELRTVWRPTGHPGFWLMGGNLGQSRVYSKFVALQIAATHLGLVTPLPN